MPQYESDNTIEYRIGDNAGSYATRARIPPPADNTIEYRIGDNAWWNLCDHLAEVTLAGLQQFKQADRNGHPANLPLKEGEEQWETILDKMIYAFTILSDSEFLHSDVVNGPEVDEGLALYAQYFRCLWD